ncbi:MAG TPA: hemolysin family protein [Bacteroidales bacterium]|nr:hemolysin family protein [Bacteroidales bacterium]
MNWIFLIIVILFSAFFSGMEIAFVASNKLRLELASKETGISSKILAMFNNNPSRYISAMLIGNNVVLVIYGIIMANILENPLSQHITNEFYVLLLQTIISTLIILLFGEFVPKTLFRAVSNSALKTFSIPLVVFYYLFYPIASATVWFSSKAIRIISKTGVDYTIQERVFSKLDIEDIIEKSKSENKQSKSSQELRIFQNAMDFSTIKLRECIIPRNDIIAVSVNTEIAGLREKFIESGHSNILVYKDNIDQIEAYVNVKDIFKNPQKLRSIMRQVLIVPETMSAKKLFENLVKENKSLAVVVDEFGSTSGMVTIEDILEEIFGEFEDEHDAPEMGVVITNEGNFILSGRQEIDVFNDEYGFELSESDEYETIAGYILFHTGVFPKEGSILTINDNGKTFKFKIIKLQDTRIEKLMLFDI